MTWPIVIALIAGMSLFGAAAVATRRRHPILAAGDGALAPVDQSTSGGSRILFPFMAHALSMPALDAALRLARAEGATVVAVYLARVSLDLPLDAPIARQCGVALPLQEAVEQRAARFGVGLELRLERGRSDRHALRRAIDRERFDQIVVAAASTEQPGLQPDDVSWLLGHASGEIVILRPGHGTPIEHRPPGGTSARLGHAPDRRQTPQPSAKNAQALERPVPRVNLVVNPIRQLLRALDRSFALSRLPWVTTSRICRVFGRVVSELTRPIPA